LKEPTNHRSLLIVATPYASTFEILRYIILHQKEKTSDFSDIVRKVGILGSNLKIQRATKCILGQMTADLAVENCDRVSIRNMYIHVYIYICIYIHTYVCIYTWICINIHVYIYINVYDGAQR